MNKKIAILGGLVVVALLAGSVLLTMQKRGQQEMVVQNGSNDRDIVQTNNSVTDNWKTYRNEEYGFEFRYPEEWILEEFVTAGIGLPVDCKQTPLHKYCKNFGVVVMENSNQATKRYVALEVSNRSSEKNTQTVKKEEVGSEDTWTTWEKRVDARTIVKNSSYFPIFGSCWVTANPIPYLSIRKGEGYHFYSLYEVPGNLYEDETADYCSKEIPDETFDKIVGSFTVLP